VAEAEGEAGDVVSVFDRKGRFLGRGFYNPKSEITIRIAERRDELVDEPWFRIRIARALAYCETLEVDGDAYRLLYAEADAVPGVVVDRYGDQPQHSPLFGAAVAEDSLCSDGGPPFGGWPIPRLPYGRRPPPAGWWR
jgi:23S rRNA G2069 N7-methylase RlmK/C1962 C5-methylase RlmI